MTHFPVEKIRLDFPILEEKIRNKPLVYLDNAASCQKPNAVIDTISHVYRHDYANVHRGVHTLSVRSTDKFESAREKIRAFINADSTKEIIITKGTTESINLVAQTYGKANLKPGDEILITAMEHHSNIVPWQMLCEQTGAILKVAPINQQGELIVTEFEKLLGDKTRLVAVVHMSNALGTINPVKNIIDLAHSRSIPVLLDGAQAIPHMAVDVQALDCDFYAFSGHKLYGPSGVGILYGKRALLEAMPPYQGGGDMIRKVTFEETEYNSLPYKFEAGTPSIADVIGLGAAIDYLNDIGMDAIAAYEAELLDYATEKARQIKGLRIIGEAAEKGAILSFVLDRIHPHDIGTMLDSLGVAIRAGHHCAMPVMDFYEVPATARASFAMYNTQQEIDVLMNGIESLIEVFG
ncbi:MAG: cysteine desulfurase [Methylicorpusculum sp.]|uniref:aminotransferase class V-fold PLP-dependent enzyme n=2 Tax=Methylicorpusculum sp. TaxID=2713644 RepID=UPI002728BE6C|nr:cysteine desulfurase [Methylicorpusculum sp.]MDO8941124.1 cysteine desulfurase [Methylicorpusculum sp.]MDP2176948.1 cysteine desulfurase [Methylicorpusculum sp.]MDP2204581.1 cysteine desulfurase [Methylicorpusculum sp.]MDP3528718.1 cysteine desulfurase [Methylicorpusculum sp.]